MDETFSNVSLGTGRILVVDDSPTVRLKLIKAAKNLGHEAVAVEDGAQALACLETEEFDIILLDIVMPHMDGFDVLEKLRADDRLSHIPTIVVSSLEDMDDVVKAIKLGAIDFLPKNFDPVLLKARVDVCLERKRMRDLELEYLQQVNRLTEAAVYLEKSDFNPADLDLKGVDERSDALGHLARVFVQMAGEIYRREQMLRRQISLLKGGFLLLMLGVCWGLIPPLSRMVMLDGLPPLGLAPWVLGMSAAIMVAVTVARGRRPSLDLPSLRYYLVWGLLGGVLPQVVLFWVAGNVQAVIISIVIITESFIVFLLAASIGLEPPSLKRFSGLAFGLVGVLLIIFPELIATGGQSWIWVLAALLVPLCYSIEDILIAAKEKVDDDPIASLAAMLVVATLLSVPIAFAADVAIPLNDIMSQLGLVLAFIALFSAGGNALLILLIRKTGAVFASQSAYAVTICGIVWSMLLLDEQMTNWIWGALACMMVGLILVMPKEEKARTDSISSDVDLANRSGD